MKKISLIKCDPENKIQAAKKLKEKLNKHEWVQLLSPLQKHESIPEHLLPKEPGVIISSGGSTGEPLQCLQPYKNLDKSAISTAIWLKEQGIDPHSCLIINPLPLHHVSGLMPWWRSKLWGARHHWVLPSLIKNPIALEEEFNELFIKEDRPIITSLVPTQLHRLLLHKAGLRWLKYFDIIWVGGAPLSKEIENIARDQNLRLSPCYGTTETAAMICALTPNEFLNGNDSCGSPLNDVEIAISSKQILKIRTSRLANFAWKKGELHSILDKQGWWTSSDLAKLNQNNLNINLEIISRVDTAIISGGETIFLEKLEERLLIMIKRNNFPIDNLILTSIKDSTWGERLICLIKSKDHLRKESVVNCLNKIHQIIQKWPEAERPKQFIICKDLKVNINEKWNRKKWKNWAENQLKRTKKIYSN